MGILRTGLIGTFASTAIATMVNAQDLGQDLPLSMGEVIESAAQSPQLTVREPVYVFLEDANGETEHQFDACTSDGGYFAFSMTLKADMAFANEHLRKLGENGYQERVNFVAQSIISAFQEVAAATHGQDLFNMYRYPERYHDEAITFSENISAVHDYTLGDSILGENAIHPNFVATDVMMPNMIHRCNNI